MLSYWEEVKQELKAMLAEGVIERSQSDWVSPHFKEGQLSTLCVGYRKLNAQSKVDAYPTPRIEDILDQVGKASFITTLDLAWGSWQVPVADEDKHKTVTLWSVPILCNAIWTKWSTCHLPKTYE